MEFQYDLFISYKSEDREWARRLNDDLRRDYPLLRIFWDRTGIQPGDDFRKVLGPAIQTSAHLLVFWTGLAAQSSEVLDEVSAFNAHKAVEPAVGKGTRRLFYVPLEGQHPPLESTQGFAEFRRQGTFDANAADRGTPKLDVPPARAEWDRMIRSIGDICLAGMQTQPVTLAVLAMNTAIVDLLDPVVGLSVVGPPLADMLNDISTTLPALKQRYGATAFEWRPFGTTDTVIDLMERLRVDVNAPLQSDYRFHWVPTDLYAEVTRRRTPAEVDQLVDSLGATPSVVIVDQLSLYNPLVYTVFVRLGNYAKKEHAAIISFAPSRTEKTDIVLRSIEGYGGPVLGAYLNPQIPAAGTFARCGVNVQHAQDVKRLIRSSLGLYYVQQKKLQGDAVTKG